MGGQREAGQNLVALAQNRWGVSQAATSGAHCRPLGLHDNVEKSSCRLYEQGRHIWDTFHDCGNKKKSEVNHMTIMSVRGPSYEEGAFALCRCIFRPPGGGDTAAIYLLAGRSLLTCPDGSG